MANVYEMITERILAQMQKGIIPWNRPWAAKRAQAAVEFILG